MNEINEELIISPSQLSNDYELLIKNYQEIKDIYVDEIQKDLDIIGQAWSGVDYNVFKEKMTNINNETKIILNRINEYAMFYKKSLEIINEVVQKNYNEFNNIDI